MISLFEQVGVEVPVELVTRGGRGASLLEFVAFPEPVVEVAVEAEAVFAVDERAVQTAAMVAAAREEAAAEARRACEVEFAARLEEERERIERIAEAFAADREKYFAAVEGEVVRLAMAVARRVLTREVESDAMHLEATVRAALARVSDGSRSTLRVNAFEAGAWRETLGGEVLVEVFGEERMAAGECVLETSVGRVELGARAQTEEIERGFAELLERKGA